MHLTLLCILFAFNTNSIIANGMKSMNCSQINWLINGFKNDSTDIIVKSRSEFNPCLRIAMSKLFQMERSKTKTLKTISNAYTNLIIWQEDLDILLKQSISQRLICLQNPCFVINVRTEDINDYEISIGQQIYFVVPFNETSNSFRITERYTVNGVTEQKSHRLQNIQSGIWWLSETFYSRRSNFHGLTIRAVTDEHLPYVIIEGTKSIPGNNVYKQVVSVSGILPDLLMDIPATLNLSLNYFQRVDGLWGTQLENGVKLFTT